MLAIFCFQDVAEFITIGLESSGAKAIDEEKHAYKAHQELDNKAKFLLYQSVSPKIFNKVSKGSTAKEIWDILIKTYGDGDKNKKVKLQTLCKQFEFITMNENETI